MLYTLGMFALWAVLAAVVGGLVGWSLAVVGRRRRPAADVAADEVDRLRRQVAELEALIATRDKEQRDLPVDPRRGAPAGPGPGTPVPVDPVSTEPVPGTPVPGTPVPVDPASTEPVPVDPVPVDPVPVDPGVLPVVSDEEPSDLDGAEEVLGERIRRDDLTVIRGLDDRLAELCGGIGVTSWRALAATPVDDLHSMLDAAGEPDDVPHLETWPRQAALLAAADWDGFKVFVDELGTDR